MQPDAICRCGHRWGDHSFAAHPFGEARCPSCARYCLSDARHAADERAKERAGNAGPDVFVDVGPQRLELSSTGNGTASTVPELHA